MYYKCMYIISLILRRIEKHMCFILEMMYSGAIYEIVLESWSIPFSMALAGSVRGCVRLSQLVTLTSVVQQPCGLHYCGWLPFWHPLHTGGFKSNNKLHLLGGETKK